MPVSIARSVFICSTRYSGVNRVSIGWSRRIRQMSRASRTGFRICETGCRPCRNPTKAAGIHAAQARLIDSDDAELDQFAPAFEHHERDAVRRASTSAHSPKTKSEP